MINLEKGIFMITGMSNIVKSHWIAAIEEELVAKNIPYGKLYNPRNMPVEPTTVIYLSKTNTKN